MTAEQLAEMQHGKFVVVDIEVGGDAVHAMTYNSASSNGRWYGIIRFKTTREASVWIEGADEGVVVARNTSNEDARLYVETLLMAARRAFEAANRFLEVAVNRDGTIRFRQSIHSGGFDWKVVEPAGNLMLSLVVQSMLAELGVPFED